MSKFSKLLESKENELEELNDSPSCEMVWIARNKIITYRDEIFWIKGRINILETEADELRLVNRHLKDEREYTLDLNRLTALGFEA
jgi:hypothetical protein